MAVLTAWEGYNCHNFHHAHCFLSQVMNKTRKPKPQLNMKSTTISNRLLTVVTACARNTLFHITWTDSLMPPLISWKCQGRFSLIEEVNRRKRSEECMLALRRETGSLGFTMEQGYRRKMEMSFMDHNMFRSLSTWFSNSIWPPNQGHRQPIHPE